ncbi:endonuclease [Thalassotalea nanhaiensis]|uniref:Endonuclease n=1 Tax=Thalassotalea nanhaiensis TaxID=3065648 RepID=A0ABY9TM61_9GAMM|nr:endonuclease [Colwelliaceae bacterium SQ345]
MIKILIATTVLTALLQVTAAELKPNQVKPTSFSTAKKRAEKYVYYDQVKTFYCGCDYVFDDTEDFDNDGNTSESMIMPNACGYVPRTPITSSGNANARISRIEWEHVVPAAQFGQHRACWHPSGNDNSRRNCARTDISFKFAEGDMHNLVPAVGELNGDRSDFRFSNVAGEPRVYGQCDFEVDFDSDTAEPTDNVKGDIARIYLYMIQKNDAQVTDDEKAMFEEWNKLDPVSGWECMRDERISRVQGNHNPFVHGQC